MKRWFGFAGFGLYACALLLTACDDGSASASNDNEAMADASTGESDAGANAVDSGSDETDVAGEADSGADETDAAVEDAGTPPAAPLACGPAAPTIRDVAGRVYRDADGSDESVFASVYEPEIDEGIADHLVQLVGVDEILEARTCDDGSFAFLDLDDGVYLIAPRLDMIAPQLDPEIDGSCGRRNCPRRMVDAVAEGEIVMVTLGDSIPVQGANPTFPARVATLLGPLVEVDNRNIAVGGSTSDQWVPGAQHFERRLAPHIDDADLVVISVGGNDILRYASDPGLLQDIPVAIEGAYAAIDDIMANVIAIIGAIRDQNQTTDIVFCLYVDYSQAVDNALWRVVNSVLGADAVSGILRHVREQFPRDIDVVLVDLFGASEGLSVDALLADPLHLNDIGHTFYAQHLFEALGGVLIGPSPLGPEAATPVGVEPTWSITE